MGSRWTGKILQSGGPESLIHPSTMLCLPVQGSRVWGQEEDMCVHHICEFK
jgi:hypothetical protein